MMRTAAYAVLSMMLLTLLTACYSDMQYGKDEPDEDEQDASWWCKYRDNCEKKDPDTWW